MVAAVIVWRWAKSSCGQHKIPDSVGGGVRGVSIYRCLLNSTGIPKLKIRRSHDRLIFNMWIPIHEKTVFILRRDPVRQQPWYTPISLNNSSLSERRIKFVTFNVYVRVFLRTGSYVHFSHSGNFMTTTSFYWTENPNFTQLYCISNINN